MFRFVVALAALAGVSAFAPAAKANTRGQLSMSKKSTLFYDWKTVNKPLFLKDPLAGFSTNWLPKQVDGKSGALPWSEAPEIGGGDLAGDKGFDPWGLSKLFPLSWLRAAELKHGRVCMLASVGLIAPELVQNPVGYNGLQFDAMFTEMNPVKALGAVPGLGIAQIILFAGLVEIFTFKSNYDGTFTFDDGLTAIEREDISGGAFKFLTGGAKNALAADTTTKFQSLSVTDETVAGDLGWDPLGFADNGINPIYAEAELKHGRVAMLGALGMLIQASKTDVGVLEYTAKWFAGEA